MSSKLLVKRFQIALQRLVIEFVAFRPVVICHRLINPHPSIDGPHGCPVGSKSSGCDALNGGDQLQPP